MTQQLITTEAQRVGSLRHLIIGSLKNYGNQEQCGEQITISNSSLCLCASVVNPETASESFSLRRTSNPYKIEVSLRGISKSSKQLFIPPPPKCPCTAPAG